MKEIISNSDSVRSGFFDPTSKSVAEVASGETVRYVNTWTHWGNEAKFGMSFAEREPLRHQYPKGPYSLIGPVTVPGAQPGETIEVQIKEIRPIAWGWNSFPIGVGALPSDFKEPYVHYFEFNDERTRTEFVKGVGFDLHPFLGVIGLEPAGDAETSGILAGTHGGNLDFKGLTAGATIYLPVEKAGGRLWLGSIVAVQGDGVVDQTGIETAAERLEIQLFRRQVTIPGPIVATADHWYLFGFSDHSLDEALVAALRTTIQWLSQASSLDESEVYALASMVMDFGVTQYANQENSAYAVKPPKGIYVSIPKEVFPPEEQARITTYLKGGVADDGE